MFLDKIDRLIDWRNIEKLPLKIDPAKLTTS